MEEKSKLLEQIKNLVAQGIITKDDLLHAYTQGKYQSTNDIALFKRIKPLDILYIAGSIIVFLGIVILVIQNWDSFSSTFKILATLVCGGLIIGLGYILSRYKSFLVLAQVSYIIGLLLSTIGFFVFFDILGMKITVDKIGAITAVITYMGMSGLTWFLYKYIKYNIFYFFLIIFLSLLYFSSTMALFGSIDFSSLSGDDVSSLFHIFYYDVLILGTGYLVLWYHLRNTQKDMIAKFLLHVGIFGTLLAALLLGGYAPSQTTPWEIVFPFLCLGYMYASILLHTSAFLIWGTFFIMVDIIKITAEYFSNVVGWPVSLICSGLTLICIGYASFIIKSKYLRIKNRDAFLYH